MLSSSCRRLVASQYTPKSRNPTRLRWFNHGIPGFTFIPDYLSVGEQMSLLSACLKKLDSSESLRMRRRRDEYIASLSKANPVSFSGISPPTMMPFLPDRLYQFEEGHFDGVIKHYREMHVSSWDQAASLDLLNTLKRLEDLYPSSKDCTQTHILHLAAHGDIHPHVDNVEASGSWILGVSLGATRLLRMEPVDQGSTEQSYELLLPSGSVYVQRDQTRYRYKHSIVRDGLGVTPGQRLSLIVRDHLPSSMSVSSRE